MSGFPTVALVGAFIAAASALLFEAMAVPPLSRLDAADCTPAEHGRLVIATTKLVEVLLQKVPRTAADVGKVFDPAAEVAAEAIARLKPTKRQAAMSDVRNDIEDLIKFPRQGNFRLAWNGPADQRPVTADTAAVQLFKGDASQYTVECVDSSGAPLLVGTNAKKDRSGPFDAIRIASDLDNARKSELKGRGFATVSFRRDQLSDEDTITVKGAALFPRLVSVSPDADYGFQISPYVAYNRETATLRANETNDLTFGLLADVGLGDSTLAIAASWTTDDRFNSSMTKVELTLDPGFDFDTYGRYYNFPDSTFDFRWFVALKADYADVGDIGDKASLASISQYQRVGFDVEGLLRWSVGDEDIFYLKAGYQLREDIRDDVGDADLFTASLEYLPRDDSQFSFGLVYEDGQNLTSLKRISNWKLTLGFRQ